MRFTTLLNYCLIDWWFGVDFCLFTYWFGSRFLLQLFDTRNRWIGLELSSTNIFVLQSSRLTKCAGQFCNIHKWRYSGWRVQLSTCLICLTKLNLESVVVPINFSFCVFSICAVPIFTCTSLTVLNKTWQLLALPWNWLSLNHWKITSDTPSKDATTFSTFLPETYGVLSSA